jgi:hypothetical protein
VANSYATVPAIIPGDLKVQGNLTVAGTNFILGKLARKYRIQEIANGWFDETVNLDRIATTQDDATSLSEVRWISPASAPFNIATQAAGQPTTDNYLLSQSATAFLVFSPELRVGAVLPYARVRNSPAQGGAFSVNLQSDGLTRDDATKPGFQFGYNSTANLCQTYLVDVAGNAYYGDLRRVFWLDHNTYTKTGTTVIQAVTNHTIYGNQLGPWGGVLLRVNGLASTVAGGSVSLYVAWSATNYLVASIPASQSNVSFWFTVLIVNRGATNSQNMYTSSVYAGTALTEPPYTATADTTVNQLLQVSTLNGNVADSVTVSSIEAEFISRAAVL